MKELGREPATAGPERGLYLPPDPGGLAAGSMVMAVVRVPGATGLCGLCWGGASTAPSMGHFRSLKEKHVHESPGPVPGRQSSTRAVRKLMPLWMGMGRSSVKVRTLSFLPTVFFEVQNRTQSATGGV